MSSSREKKEVILLTEVKSEDQHEIRVLQDIIEQFNQFSDRKEAAEISKKILQILNGEIIDLESFRTQLLNIYYQEDIHSHWYDEHFYGALFSLLLLLIKYNPVNLVCPISLEEINPNSRLLTISGQQFDLENLKKWIERKPTHPVTMKIFSPRELSYFNARANNQVSEIPHPKQPYSKWENFKSNAKIFNYKFYNYRRSEDADHFPIVWGIILGTIVMEIVCLVIAIAFPATIPAEIFSSVLVGFGSIGGFVGGIVGSLIGTTMHRNTGQAPILLGRNENKPFIDPNRCIQLLCGIKQKPQPPFASNEASSGLSTSQVNNSLNLNRTPVNNLTQPLLPNEPVDYAFLQRVEEKAKNDRLLAAKSTPQPH